MARGKDERNNQNRKVDRGRLGPYHPLYKELRQQRKESGIDKFYPREHEIDRRLRERPKGPEDTY